MFERSTLAEHTCAFSRACISFFLTLGSEKTPRPFGQTVPGTIPNDFLPFDYIDLDEGKNGYKYGLRLHDDHLNYNLLYCLPDTPAENAAVAIIEFGFIFGVLQTLISDGPTHFTNKTLRLVTRDVKVPHHFTFSYCPWNSGKMKRIGREAINVLRATLSELKMNRKECPDLIPIVQSVLYSSPSP